jgi:hypothetical protein
VQATQNLVPVGVSVGDAKSPPKAVRVDVDFATEATQQIDLKTQVMRGGISCVQGAYVFNNTGAALQIACDDTGQTQEIADGSQGWIVLLCSDFPTFTVSSSGGGVARFHFVNYPVRPAIW